MLGLSDVHTYYGNIRALRGVSLAVEPGEIVTLIGANGAGKTTTLKTILGTVRPRRGTVTFNGHRLDTLATDRIVRLGIAQSPEGRRIFPRMTVLENLELGAFVRRDREAIGPDLERVFALFPRLRERIEALLGEAPIDETRIATEVAVWAEKTDISEELARLTAHLDQLAHLLDEGGPVGRTLDFLIQEINREVNTVGSKADDLEISQAVIATKSVLEKLREQTQNLE